MTNNQITKKTREFFKKFPEVKFANKETLLNAGQKSNDIFFLKSGLVKQQATGPTGKAIIIHQYQPGSFFNLHWLETNGQNDFSYQAIGKVETTTAPLAAVSKWLQSQPEITFHTLQRFSAGLDGLAHRLQILTTAQTSPRIISLLSYLANHYGKKQDNSLIIPFRLTHNEIASWVGVTRETASLALGDLQKKNLIDRHRGLIRIRDLNLLKKHLQARI